MISEILRRTDAEMEAEALKLPLPKLMELDQYLKKIPVGVVRTFFGGLSRAVTRALEAHWRHQVQVQAALQCPMC